MSQYAIELQLSRKNLLYLREQCADTPVLLSVVGVAFPEGGGLFGTAAKIMSWLRDGSAFYVMFLGMKVYKVPRWRRKRKLAKIALADLKRLRTLGTRVLSNYGFNYMYAGIHIENECDFSCWDLPVCKALNGEKHG